MGEGFRFGYKAAGDTAALLELGAAQGLEVSVVSLVSSGCTDGPEKVCSYREHVNDDLALRDSQLAIRTHVCVQRPKGLLLTLQLCCR